MAMPALVLLPPLPPEEVVEREPDPPPVRTALRGTKSYSWQRGRRPSESFGFAITTPQLLGDPRPVATKEPERPRPTHVSRRRQKLIRKYVGADGVRVRGKGVAFIGLTEFERAEMDRDVAELEAAGAYDQRPVQGNGVGGDCPTGTCPWVGCRYNNYLTTDPETGSIRLNFPGKAIDEIGETCSMRYAESGPMTVREVAKVFGIAHQRVHQLETAVLVKIRRGVATGAVRPRGKG